MKMLYEAHKVILVKLPGLCCICSIPFTCTLIFLEKFYKIINVHLSLDDNSQHFLSDREAAGSLGKEDLTIR